MRRCRSPVTPLALDFSIPLLERWRYKRVVAALESDAFLSSQRHVSAILLLVRYSTEEVVVALQFCILLYCYEWVGLLINHVRHTLPTTYKY